MSKKIILSIIVLISLIGFIFYREQQGFIKTTESSALQVVFMDIGQGDATLITFPNGQKMVVDCARDAIVLAALGRNMSWFDRQIDYLVVTHPDADHYGGCIDVLKQYDVKHIYVNGFDKKESKFLEEFYRAVADEQIQGALVEIVSTTDRLMVASTTVQFLYPDHSIANDPHVPGVREVESNNTSIIIKVAYAGHSILLTGDMEQPLEDYLVKKNPLDLASDILKIGHHGSQSSSGNNFLEVVKPKFCTVSVGKNNRYGHPSPRVLKRLTRSGCEILRTDLVGDIMFTVNQDSIKINHVQK